MAAPSTAWFSPASLSTAKANAVRVLMGLIMLVTGTYLGFDWAAFFHGFTSTYPARAGYARTILCAILVWLIGVNHVERRDAHLLGLAFALTLGGDWFLIVENQTLPGTALFLVVHALLIVRHARGFRASLAPSMRARTLRLLASSAIVIYGGAGAILLATESILKRTGMFALDVVYLLVLTTSMWMAWGTLIRGWYASRNAWFIALGMTSFFLCDVSVGLAGALAGTPRGAIINDIVGFFYSPALVLLAYSGYRWDGLNIATRAAPALAAE
jgi:hypothetical protein